MDHARRKVLKMVAALGAAGVVPAAWAQQWNQDAFAMKSIPDAFKALGAQSPATSDAVVIRAPDIAENGAVVPFTISSKLPKTEQLALLVEKNPNVLAASFNIPQGTEASVNTRVKMGGTSNVIALVKADGKFYYTTKEVKVTLGGCGG